MAKLVRLIDLIVEHHFELRQIIFDEKQYLERTSVILAQTAFIL